MKTLRRVALLVCLLVCSVGFSGGAVHALTPTPAVTASPTPAATPTPMPNQLSIFTGGCWLNARPCVGQTMTARIAGKVCATDSMPLTPADSNRSVYRLVVPSRDIVPGCGSDGATIDFFVGDQLAAPSATWHAGTTQTMSFIAGPLFAMFGGGIEIAAADHTAVLAPYVNEKACGYASHGFVVPDLYEAIVFSSQQESGCGIEGAQVSFKLLDAQGNVIAVANEKGIWHAWDGHQAQQLNLTFGPVGGIRVGNIGTGDGSDGEGSAWGRLSILLGFVGVAGAALGLALRRRAMAR